jgi:hypothetical protein
VAELTDAVADSPGRERFVAQLMIALYRSGRTADSLAVYRRARQTLTEEYGLEPGRALRDLERLVLLGDQALAMPGQRPATAPEPIGSNGGGLVNGQRVDPRDGAPGIHHDAGSATVRERPAPLPVPAQLPLQPRGFIGRAAELARLDGLLAARAESPTATVVCALSGTAGVGKTTLAVHWAHRVADQFPDGQLYVDLRGFGPGGAPVEPEAAIRGFLDALAVPVERVPADQDAQAALYRSVLAGRRMLVVLDNARDTAQVRPLLPGSSTTMVLVTSRDKLAGLVAGVGAAPLVLDVLSTAEAKELVAARVDAGRVEAAPDAVTDIVALCARLPLTLAIAAGRAASRPALPLDALAAELRDAHHRLDAFDTGDAGTDVRGVFSWSYQRLGPDAARLFRLLGLHPGRDLTVAAAASLFGVAPRLVRPLVAELTRASLLTELTIGRYTCHDLLRAYAVELASMVDLADDRRAAVTRLLDGYVAAARNAMDALSPADPAESNGRRRLPASASASAEQFRSPAEARAWLDAELPNLLALATHAAREGWPAQAAQLSDILALEKARHDCPGGPTAKHLPATVTHPPATVTHLPAERRSTWVNMKALMIVDSERRTAGGETGLVVCCDDGVAPSDKCPASGGWGTVPRAQ